MAQHTKLLTDKDDVKAAKEPSHTSEGRVLYRVGPCCNSLNPTRWSCSRLVTVFCNVYWRIGVLWLWCDRGRLKKKSCNQSTFFDMTAGSQVVPDFVLQVYVGWGQECPVRLLHWHQAAARHCDQCKYHARHSVARPALEECYRHTGKNLPYLYCVSHTQGMD